MTTLVEHLAFNRARQQEPVEVTGIWLVRLGNSAIVRAEIDGRWVDVISEGFDGSYSHIVEPAGMRAAADKAGPVP